MKFRVKSVIAYMIIACMLMTFMPVLAEETVVNNYFETDFGYDRPLNGGSTVNSGVNYLIPVDPNGSAFYGYVYAKGEYTYDEDETKVGLYHTVDGTYVTGKADNSYASGSEYRQTKSTFINDFEFKGTLDGTTYTLPIVSYGKTSGHDTFQFCVDATEYDALVDSGEGATWASANRANWSDVKIVHKATGKELAARTGFGMYSPFRIDFCTVQELAEAFPEYFTVGRKVTAEGSRTAYAYGHEGAIGSTCATLTTDIDLVKKANMKFTYNGTEYEMPIKGIRGNGTTVYVALSYGDFNKATGLSLTDSEFRAFAGTDTLSNFKLTSKKTYIGSFPKTSIFVSPITINGGNRADSNTDSYGNGAVGIRYNADALTYTFTAPATAEYDIYALRWTETTGSYSNQRATKFSINGTEFTTAGKHTMYDAQYAGDGGRYNFYEPVGSVTLDKNINKFYLGPNGGTGIGYPQFMGIVLVPKSENFSLTAAESYRLASMVYDTRTETPVVSSLLEATGYTLKAVDYDTQTFTVTVDGTEYTVKAGTGVDVANTYYDAQGNFITGATVTDALATAGLSKRNASDQVNAIFADGKNVNPDRTLLYNGMAITVKDGASVTKADFAPVLRSDIISSSGETTNNAMVGVGMNTSSNFKGTTAATSYTKLFPFMTANTADITEAADDNLIGCKVWGYMTVASAISEVLNHANTVSAGITSMRTGDKIYFLGDPIVKVTASMSNIWTGDVEGHKSTASKSSYVNTLAIKSAEDPTVGVHNPFQFYNQKATATYGYYKDLNEWFIANTSAVNEITAANKIKDGKWQLLTTGTVPCQIMIVDANGAVKSILKDQVVTGIAPLTITLEEGEKAFVWKSTPYNGTVSTSRIWDMKPLCEVLTY